MTPASAITSSSLFLSLLFYQVRGDYDSSYVYIQARSPTTGEEVTECGNFQQYLFQTIQEDPEEELEIARLMDKNGDESLSVCADKVSEVPDVGTVVPSWYRLHQLEDDCQPPDINVSTELAWQVQRLQNDSDHAGNELKALLFLVEKGKEFIMYNGRPVKDLLFSEFRDGFLPNSLSSVPVFFVYKDTYERSLMSVGSDAKLSFYRPNQLGFDPAMIVVFVIAVFCVSVGGWWSGKLRYQLEEGRIGGWKYSMREAEERAEVKAQLEARLQAGEEIGVADDTTADNKNPTRTETPEPAAAPFTWLSTIVFVAVIVGMLLLLYYFYQYFVWFIIGTYCLAGTLAIYECTTALAEACCEWGGARIPWSVDEVWRLLTGKEEGEEGGCCCQVSREHPRWRNVVIFLCAAAFCICWCIFRKWPYAFLLQDTISIFFSINLIKSLRMPSLKWITVLLSALLIYDLFMVFITPAFTKNGCSVMVEVATGSPYCRDTSVAPTAPPNAPLSPVVSEREQLPILILVPRLKDPMLPCYDLDVNPRLPSTMLGLGDIILPGLLIGFCFAVDDILKTRYYVYGITCVIAYGLGLITTFAALLLSKMAQPALIYLVPFTLVATFILALARKELHLLWSGEMEAVHGSQQIKDTLAVEEEGPANYRTINE